MEHRQVDGIDAYGFPSDLRGNPLLGWMGDDYVRFIAIELLERFQSQDPETEMLAIKCESQPDVASGIEDGTGVVRRVTVKTELQVLLRSKSTVCWRLRGVGPFEAQGLHTPSHTAVTVGFEIQSTEQVG